jgi:retinoblastoma-like protein 2
MPSTPLTGKKYLGEREENSECPISQATQSVSLLQAMLSGRKPEPSAHLTAILSSCNRNPTAGIVERVKTLSDSFCDNYSKNKLGASQPGLFLEFAHYRSALGQTLYFRLLENIISVEMKQMSKSDKSELTVSTLNTTF